MLSEAGITSRVVGKKAREPDSTPLWVKFGRWLKSQRQDRRITQQALADGIGMHQVHVSRIENGHSGTKRETVIEIARFLELNVTDTLRRAGFSDAETTEARITASSKMIALAHKFDSLPAKKRPDAEPLIDVLDREIDRLLSEQ